MSTGPPHGHHHHHALPLASQNDLSELFMLLHFLEPEHFDSLGAPAWLFFVPRF